MSLTTAMVADITENCGIDQKGTRGKGMAMIGAMFPTCSMFYTKHKIFVDRPINRLFR